MNDIVSGAAQRAVADGSFSSPLEGGQGLQEGENTSQYFATLLT